MKIIAGLAKGTKLAGPKHLNIRPTENRVKEAIFSIIHFQIQNSTVLDLFAGSGQLALEALSRGAAFSTCVDNSRYANKIQIENFKKAKLSDKVKLVGLRKRGTIGTFTGREHTEETKAIMRESHKGKHKGSSNSQFGTYWITNGSDSMKWSDKKGDIPDGYYRGRGVKFLKKISKED